MHTGPLYIKVNGKSQKAYVCLFTRSTSLAVHLEVVPCLSASAFIRCLKRFIARRGVPARITSDNLKTFKTANKELEALFKDPDVQRFVSQEKIIWKFILEKAPWFGGIYERMVQLVKRVLRKILGNAKLDFEELTTVIVEVEGTINSRPLAYICSDDFEEPITPSHLVIGRRILSLPYPDELDDPFDNDYDATELEKRARYLHTLLGHFWKRWTKEYLLNLREYHHSREVNREQGHIQVGDVVIVKEDNVPRGRWKVAVVEHLIVNKDEEIRGAIVRLVNKKGTFTRLRRSIQHLYPIEVTSEHKGDKLDNSIDVPETDIPQVRIRPRRAEL